jgi:Erythromycin esterase
LERSSDKRFVLLGEASHGTHEFYRERAEITKRLIAERGFTVVPAEADWPDAYRVNLYVRGESDDESAEEALSLSAELGERTGMLRLIEAHLAAAGNAKTDRAAPVLLLGRRDELDAFPLQLVDRPVEVMAHEEELVIADRTAPTRSGMDTELGRRQGEDQPALSGVHEAKPEYVSKECSRSLRVVDVEQSVNAGDHGPNIYP